MASEADTTVVVVNPGWGDSVQASKAGLMEIADVFVINKADRAGVSETQSDIEGMIELSRGMTDGWRPPVLRATAAEGVGIDDVWAAVVAHRASAELTGQLTRRRQDRMRAELQRIVRRLIELRVVELTRAGRLASVEDDVIERRMDPYTAAQALIESALAGDRPFTVPPG